MTFNPEAIETDPAMREYYKQRDLYVAFNRTPLRTKAKTEEDFDAFLNIPGLISFGFCEEGVVEIKTEFIRIKSSTSNVTHDIGDFTIRVERTWIGNKCLVRYRFRNDYKIQDGELNAFTPVFYHHPHMAIHGNPLMSGDYEEEDEDSFIWCNLCINSGGIMINQHLRRGELHKAASRMMVALNTYTKNKAFSALSHWPVSEGVFND